MNKKYTFTIQYVFGEYIILGKDNETETGSIVTSGKTLGGAIDMLADAIMTVEGVKVSYWNKLLNKLRIYR